MSNEKNGEMSKFISYISFNQTVYDAIKAMIVNGELPPESRLQEDLLVELVGTSKTPIKLALAKLEQNGHVINALRKGASVVDLDKDKVLEVYLIREVLEGLAYSVAAKNISDKEIISLEALLKKMEEALKTKNSDKFLKLDDQLH